MIRCTPIALLCVLFFSACTKNEQPAGPSLVFKFKFDSTQVRLNNIGQPAVMPAGNAGLSPQFNRMSAHYIELAPSAFTGLGKGAVLYHATETSAGGATAIDFEKNTSVGNGQTFYSIPLKNITPGDYEWLRISLAYQNYDIRFRMDTVISGFAFNSVYTGTIASFIGFNSYIKTFNIKSKPVAVNGNRKQGFWGFETTLSAGGFSETLSNTGQAPEGATTVPNPLFATSPIPAGSCVVTAAFTPGKLTITGKETGDIVIEIALSTNKSFEWKDLNPNGAWDPMKGEPIVDMGIRGMKPSIQ